MSLEDSKAVGPGKSRIAFLFVGSTELLHDVIHGAGLVSDGNPAGVYFGKMPDNNRARSKISVLNYNVFFDKWKRKSHVMTNTMTNFKKKLKWLFGCGILVQS